MTMAHGKAPQRGREMCEQEGAAERGCYGLVIPPMLPGMVGRDGGARNEELGKGERMVLVLFFNLLPTI